MKWKTRIVQLICSHSNCEKIATFQILATGGKIDSRPSRLAGKTITTYECLDCGRFIDRIEK